MLGCGFCQTIKSYNHEKGAGEVGWANFHKNSDHFDVSLLEKGTIASRGCVVFISIILNHPSMHNLDLNNILFLS